MIAIRDTLALIGDDDHRAIILRFAAQPDHGTRGRITHRIADEIDEDLEHTPKLAPPHQDFIGRGPVYPHAAFGGAHREKRGGPAGNVRNVHRIGLRAEIGTFDGLEIDEIVDQRHQMAPRGRDVAGIIGIVAAQRPFGLRADRLGIGDNPVERFAQRFVEPASKGIGHGKRRFIRFVRTRQIKPAGPAAKPAKPADAIEKRHGGQANARLTPPDLGELIGKAYLGRERIDERESALFIFQQLDDAGEGLADDRAGGAADHRFSRGRKRDDLQTVIGFPEPVRGGAQEIGFAGGVGDIGLYGDALRPAPDRKLDVIAVGLRAHPEIEVIGAVRRDDRARDENAEPLREPGKRCDLRHRERAPSLSAGADMQIEQLAIRLDEAAVAIDASAHAGVERAVHGTHPSPRSEVPDESAAIAAR